VNKANAVLSVAESLQGSTGAPMQLFDRSTVYDRRGVEA